MKEVCLVMQGYHMNFGQGQWNFACYLVNQSLASPLVEKTPHEALIGKKPSLKDLKVFW
jgi:hypothetical protein